MSIVTSKSQLVSPLAARAAGAVPEVGPAHRFVKVDDFFSTYQSWAEIAGVVSYGLDPVRKTLSLVLRKPDATTCGAVLEFVQANIVRFRFNPGKDVSDFSDQSSRAIVMDTQDQLRLLLERQHPFTLASGPDASPTVADVVTRDGSGQTRLRVRVDASPLRVTIFDVSSPGAAVQLWQSDAPSLFFAANGDEDYAIVHTIRKPATARYIGFGEQGGKSLVKNTEHVNFFNFDNMRYKQVYNQGPLDGREPLYHSDPFFLEFNGHPPSDAVYGIFVDNTAQCFVDIGYLNSSRYMLGTRFGDLDYYFIAGENAAGVLQDFTSLVGRSRLKPRYALGYHQGCYGYESWRDVYEAVNAYRAAAIPLDGIHIDVDVQHRYQTFTVDESADKFPNARATFADLRAKGIKCSTNITPIVSNLDPGYQTFSEGLANKFFVTDSRHQPDDPDGRRYQNYSDGFESFYQFTDPEGRFNSGDPFVGEVYYGGDRGTTGHYPDLGRREVRDWWGRQYQHLFDLGLEMVWQDMTTPAIRETRGDMRGFPFRLMVTDDSLSAVTPQKTRAIRVWNLFSYNLHKATYHGLNHLTGRANTRNFIVGRGSFTGMHRFAALWTGDNASTWDFLRMNVAQVLSLGLSGMPICGQDIGGFEAEFGWQRWADPELLMRWTMAGAFLPWFRNHYIRKGSKAFQEPYAFQFVDLANVYPIESRRFYAMVLPVCRRYIERRYRLLQLFYDAMFENTLSGMPICRSMILTDPDDKALYNDKVEFLDDQFLVGNDLLVAPLLEPQSEANGGGHVDIYLPAGSRWYCYMDNRLPLGAAVDGGTTIRDFDAGLSLDGAHIDFLLPTYVRAGAILPTIELEQFVGERNRAGQPNPITLNVYPGADGRYTMYLDDGVSRSSSPVRAPAEGGDPAAKGEYREVRITHTITGPGERQVRIERGHDGYTPPLETYFFVAILQDPSEPDAPASISLGGRAVPPVTGGSPDDRARQLAASATNAWYHNENIRISFVKVFDQAAAITIDVAF